MFQCVWFEEEGYSTPNPEPLILPETEEISHCRSNNSELFEIFLCPKSNTVRDLGFGIRGATRCSSACGSRRRGTSNAQYPCLGRAPGRDQHVFLAAHPDATTFSCCILECLCTEVAYWNISVPVQGRDPVFQCVWFEEGGYATPNPESQIPNTGRPTCPPSKGFLPQTRLESSLST